MESNNTQENPTNNILDVKKLLALLRNNFWLLILGLILGAGTALIVSRLQTPIYEAQSQVMVTRSSSSGPVTDVTQPLNAQQLSQTYVELLSQKWVRDDVAAVIGGKVNQDQIKVSAAANSMVINITTEDPDPTRARASSRGGTQMPNKG